MEFQPIFKISNKINNLYNFSQFKISNKINKL
nr:MAG TPA: hypothetical protein [Ackermannviridae sp.]